MKKKMLLLIFCTLILTGCNKFKGTWCRYTETYSHLLILEDDIKEEELNNIKKVVEKIPEKKSYDVIDDIENGNTVLTIYYTNKTDLDKNSPSLKGLAGISKIETKSFIIPSQKLVIKDNQYEYGYDLDNIGSSIEIGEYKIENDMLTLKMSNKNFYYKNKFLCTDANCNFFLQKSKNNECE